MILSCVLLTLKTGPGPSMKNAAENTCRQGTVAQACPPCTQEMKARQSGAQSHPQLQSEFEASLGYMTPSQRKVGGIHPVKIVVPVWTGRRYTTEEQLDKNINRKAWRTGQYVQRHV